MRGVGIERSRLMTGSAVGGQRHRRKTDGGRRRHWIDAVGVRRGGIAAPWQRRERQAIAHRRVARDQIHALTAQTPCGALPAGPRGGKGQHMADRALEPAFKHAPQTIAFERVFQMRIKGVDVGRQRALAPEIVVGILETRQDVRARDLKTPGERPQEFGACLGLERRLGF